MINLNRSRLLKRRALKRAGLSPKPTGHNAIGRETQDLCIKKPRLVDLDGVDVPADHLALVLQSDLVALAVGAEQVHGQPSEDR